MTVKSKATTRECPACLAEAGELCKVIRAGKVIAQYRARPHPGRPGKHVKSDKILASPRSHPRQHRGRRTVDRAGYAKYIRSEAWQEVRRPFWASKLPKECYCCGREDGAKDLHHRTYKNLGNEYLRDLVPLCRDCHDTVHEMFKYKPSLSLWGATGALRHSRHPGYGR